MTEMIVITGGNTGETARCLEMAVDLLAQVFGQPTACSGVYRSRPWGRVLPEDGSETTNDFLNQVLHFSTGLPAAAALEAIKEIEYRLGRRRPSDKTGAGNVYYSRPIDIDILFFGDSVINTPELTVPHPRLHQREFVLVPLSETAPELKHPVLGKTVRELLGELKNKNISE